MASVGSIMHARCVIHYVLRSVDATHLDVLLTEDVALLRTLDVVPAASVDIILELREPTPLFTVALRARAELTSLGGSPKP